MSEMITNQDEQVVCFLNSLDCMIDGLERLVLNYKPPFKGETYLTDKEVSERLKISRRTLQEWRNSGKIEFIQLEGKILYTESALQRLLDKYYQKAWE